MQLCADHIVDDEVQIDRFLPIVDRCRPGSVIMFGTKADDVNGKPPQTTTKKECSFMLDFPSPDTQIQTQKSSEKVAWK